MSTTKTKQYYVFSKFYEDGHVEAEILRGDEVAEDYKKKIFHPFKKFDMWVDCFHSLKLAKECKQEALSFNVIS